MKLWGGRFTKPTDRLVEEFTASISFDRRLFRQDIAGSIVHCRMLAKQAIISAEEAREIEAGLLSVLADIEQGNFQFEVSSEDIHMAVEAALRQKVGDVAGKLHTARSRNDQVALDTRMFVKDAVIDTITHIQALQRALLDLAANSFGVILPGYTHLQRGQPMLFSHHLLAYFEMLERDLARFQGCYERTNVLPLGSGALAGVPYPIDREYVAQELGFASVSRNSVDGVSDRDFVLEYLSAASVTIMHLSRLAEEFVLWSSSEFGFVELDDAYCTGSSIMPQKKNPDVAELVRGKSGRVYGHLMGMLVTMKGLPLAYNKDMQEDKEALFDTVDTVLGSLATFAGMVSTTKVNAEAMRSAAREGFALATDLADYLVRKGTPFRNAHEIVGNLVKWCLTNDRSLESLSLDEYRRFSPMFTEDILNTSIETSVGARGNPGGTAPERVRQAIDEATARLGQGIQQFSGLRYSTEKVLPASPSS